MAVVLLFVDAVKPTMRGRFSSPPPEDEHRLALRQKFKPTWRGRGGCPNIFQFVGTLLNRLAMARKTCVQTLSTGTGATPGFVVEGLAYIFVGDFTCRVCWLMM